MFDLVGSLAENLRSELGIQLLQDTLNQIQNCELDFVRQVERLTHQARILGHLLGEMHIGCRAIFDVKIISHERPIRTDHRPLTAQNRADRTWHDAIPVQIAATIKISATGDAYRRAVGMGIRLSN